MTQDRTWRKSSYSGGTEDSSCVEVSIAQDVLVRDTKNVAGEVLTFSTSAWRAFVGQAQPPVGPGPVAAYRAAVVRTASSTT